MNPPAQPRHRPDVRNRRRPGTTHRVAALLVATAVAVAGCASTDGPDDGPALRPADARALIARLLPAGTADASGWAVDLYAAFAAMAIAPTPSNACAVIAVTEQESGFRADPSVPGLGAIARREIDARAERAGVPAFLVRAALGLASPNGKTYAQRIDGARTERELSDAFDDFIGIVPLGKSLFAQWNPVRTGGPMQVAVAFAEAHAAERPYPYPVQGSIRQEVFSRRGGAYFGIAHLLDYSARYDRMLYRFADFNAGRWASRNAALQKAISLASGIPLVADGDLVRHDGDAVGNTELAARVLAERLKLSPASIRSDLERGDRADLESSAVHRRVFELAESIEGRPLPRAAVPTIDLKSPKITRRLTTDWFAQRVDERYRRCLARAAA